jgi:hypothetical protein
LREDGGRDVQEHITISQDEQISSAKDSDEQNGTRHESINIHDLSFILHPAHEAPTSEKNTTPGSTNDGLEHGTSMMMAQACHALGVTPDALQTM